MSRLLMLVLLLTPVLTQAAPKPPPDVSLSWSVALDEKGAITSLEAVNPAYMPALQTRLEPAIRGWHFTPGKINGQPAPTQTTLILHLTFEPAGDDDYRVRLRNFGTGAYYAHTVQPRYPDSALSVRRGGAVMLSVDFDANGHITGAKPVEGGVPKPTPDMTRAAMAAVKKWTFKPETIAGHGVPGSALVPICFSMGQRDCRWRHDGEDKPLAGDEPLIRDSVVRIDSDIVGSTL